MSSKSKACTDCTVYREQALELVINQLRESPHFLKILEEQARSYDHIDCIQRYLFKHLNVDNARGVWLDLIGLIVGQPREIANAICIAFFGFTERLDARFDEERFWDGQEALTATSVLTDAEYQWAIKARINTNYADVSTTGLVESMSMLAETPDILVGRGGNATVHVFWGVHLTKAQQCLFDALDLMPVAAGIGIDRRMYGVPEYTFAFLETPLDFVGFDKGVFSGCF